VTFLDRDLFDRACHFCNGDRQKSLAITSGALAVPELCSIVSESTQIASSPRPHSPLIVGRTENPVEYLAEFFQEGHCIRAS